MNSLRKLLCSLQYIYIYNSMSHFLSTFREPIAVRAESGSLVYSRFPGSKLNQTAQFHFRSNSKHKYRESKFRTDLLTSHICWKGLQDHVSEYVEKSGPRTTWCYHHVDHSDCIDHHNHGGHRIEAFCTEGRENVRTRLPAKKCQDMITIQRTFGRQRCK